jgi:ubiquinone/menaquinone biosynthesis C-methylase UbiE
MNRDYITQGVQDNIRAHERVARRYAKTHKEIYNPIEQQRLFTALREAVLKVKGDGSPLCALDFGCGAGNLTRYLLSLNLNVTAADISPSFLKLIEKNFSLTYPGKVDIMLLNGVDLAHIPDANYDFIATYSVLHHIPDYLKAVSELSRVLKPGGVLYIDHEHSPEYWSHSDTAKKSREALFAYQKRTAPLERIIHIFLPRYWMAWYSIQKNPRYSVEGDIHVFDDDHIDWDSINNIFGAYNLEIIQQYDYLLYRPCYPMQLYTTVCKSYHDTRLIVARKRSRPIRSTSK